jgi:hypothetical protein
MQRVIEAIGALAAFAGAAPAATAEPVRFAPADMPHWSVHSFNGRTQYEAIRVDSEKVLRAVADGTGSVRYVRQRVDLRKQPYIEWRWRVDALPDTAGRERQREGDDFAVRIYVVREGFLGRLNSTTLNYIWSRRLPVGETWTSPYTSRSIRLAADSGRERLGEWVSHRRNLRADWRKAFGETIDRIDGIAIMTDADNTASRARAFYGAIRFTE